MKPSTRKSPRLSQQTPPPPPPTISGRHCGPLGRWSASLRLVLAVGALCALAAAAAAVQTVTAPKVVPDSAQRSARANEARVGLAAGEQTSAEPRVALASTQAIQSVSKWTGQQQLQPAAEASIASPKVQSGAQDMQAAAGHHHHYGKSHGGHGKYYMYAESPKKGAYKAGFRRGNHKHLIERKEWQHKSHAGGYMKWHGKKGKGSHKWEYKHSKGKHSGHHYYG